MNQSDLYNEIAKIYQDHYFDMESVYYREEIYIKKLKKYFKGSVDILEVGCGDGSNIEILEKNGILEKNFYGLDISNNNCKLFQDKFENKYKFYHADFTEKNLKLEKTFDIILLFGAIHHMYKDIEILFQNLNNHLNKNGKIIIMEPNGSFLNFIRNYWYKKDKYFEAESEKALTIKEVDLFAEKNFLKIFYEYQGLIGYFVILQSMILRTPKIIKKKTYKILTLIDKILSKFNSKYLSASYILVYKKKD
jgi:SAM-dependent methyltransferase